MNESKRISRNKYKNKQRYKDKSKVVPKENDVTKETEVNSVNENSDDDETFSHRTIESNWRRYDRKDEEEEAVAVSNTFPVPSSTPITGVNYFQFKSDKLLERDIGKQQTVNKMFTLNLELLSKSISTIPFYKRTLVPETYYTGEEILKMDSEAQQNKCEYEEYIKNLNITTKNVNESPKSDASKNTEEVPNCDVAQNAHTTTNNRENEVELTSETFTNEVMNESVEVQSKDEDLERWLDEYLDE